jgi:hypothetical protein
MLLTKRVNDCVDRFCEELEPVFQQFHIYNIQVLLRDFDANGKW